MGIVNNENARVQFDYYANMSWYVDCYTGLLKNLLIFLNLVHNTSFSPINKKKHKLKNSSSTASASSLISQSPTPSSTQEQSQPK